MRFSEYIPDHRCIIASLRICSTTGRTPGRQFKVAPGQSPHFFGEVVEPALPIAFGALRVFVIWPLGVRTRRRPSLREVGTSVGGRAFA